MRNSLVDGATSRRLQRTIFGRRRLNRRSPCFDALEHRRLLTASLQPISKLTVPALQGYTLPLDGSGTTDPQTFAVESSNPDVSVSVVSGAFWNVRISYTDPVTASNSFTGTLTFQLFGALTPNTVKMITQFTNDNYYVDTGNNITRVDSGFFSTPYTLIQGGASDSNEEGPSGQPGTPFANEDVQQLALTGTDQLSMANAGGTDSNDAQFFITTGPLNAQLGYSSTVFGQLVSGAGTLAKIAAVPVGPNSITGEKSQPMYPITITSTTLTATNSDGVVLIDATQARQGETATVTVTATDPGDGTQTAQSFQVVVGAFSGSTTTYDLDTINFKPYANPVTATTTSLSPVQVQLAGQPTYPVDLPSPATVSSYALLSSPAHGSISDFNPATGTFNYTPVPGFVGTDTFTYSATSSGPNAMAAPATSSPATVTITVEAGPVVTLKVIEVMTNKRHDVNEIVLTWSGPLNASLADSKEPFRLETADRKGSYTGRGSSTIKLRKVIYDGNDWTVTLTPKTFFPKSRKVQLLVHGTGRTGLQDIFGRFIAGAAGQPGTDSISIV